MKILICRTDRLGDLMLSLPAIALVRKALPQAEVVLLLRKAFVDVLTPWSKHERVKLQPVEEISTGVLDRWISSENFSAALFLFPDPMLMKAVKRAKVSLRVGAKSKLLTFFYFNAGRRQHRSRAKKNESEYSVELAQVLLSRLKVASPELSKIALPPSSVAIARAREKLLAIGVAEGDSYVVVHPGMAGSALNLKVEQYVDMIRKLRREPFRVLLSVGPSFVDTSYSQTIVREIPGTLIVKEVSLAVLSEIFRGARAVIAPSTGPLHLAHYVGARTIGIFSPVRSHHPQRWKPMGGSGKSDVLVPLVTCPAQKDCKGKSCPLYLCMDGVSWGDAVLGLIP